MSKPEETVAALIQAYADRGIFRGFGRKAGSGGKLELRFLWHAEEPHLLIFDPANRTFTFRDLLPNIPYRSTMDRELRRFVKGRSAPELPDHRRIDPRRAATRVTNRGGSISVGLTASTGDLEYSLRKAVNLVNEIFLSFLAGPYEAYMVENFGVPEE